MAELDLDALMEDTKRLSRVSDQASHSMALAMIEIAKQLRQINTKLDGGKKSDGKNKKK